ncbi:MAG: glycosyltransferase [Candidatus Zixiibacteriota bacterium]
MRVVFSNTASSWGGGEKWMFTAGKGLRCRGHDVFYAPKRNSPLWLKAQGNDFEILDFNIRSDFSPYRTLKIARLLAKIDADVLVLNFNKDVRVAGAAAKLAKTPFVCARHGVKLIKDKLRYRATMSLVDKIITNTRSIKNEYIQYDWLDAEKVEVIHNGIALPNLDELNKIDLNETYNLPDDYFVFALAGRLAYQKGFDVLIDGMEQLRKEKIAALIAGKGPLENDLKAMITEKNLEKKVKLIGFVERPLDFLYSSDAVALPSRYEGLPNIVMEAMALGKVVVASSVNGVPELIEDGKEGFLVPSEDAKTLAEKMRYIASKYKDVEYLGKNARAKIQNEFTIPKMIDRLEMLFQSKLRPERY